MTDTADPPPSLFRLFLRMGGWFVILLGVILLVLSLVGQSVLNTVKRFEEEGRVAQAVVVDKYIRESRDSDGDRKVTRYLTLRFETARAEQIEVSKSVGSKRYRDTGIGTEVEILYLASAPSTTELDRGSHRRGSVILQLVSLVAGLVWLALLWRIGGWAVSAVRARRYGALEDVEVVQVLKTNVKINKRPRYRLQWRDGQGQLGESLMHPPGKLDAYSQGDRIQVYRGIKFMWWTGDVGMRPVAEDAS